jgi:predicted RNase H-like nuclease (RuvC/YqgF family)
MRLPDVSMARFVRWSHLAALDRSQGTNTMTDMVERLRARFKDLWREKECDELRAEVERLRGHKEEADRHIATIAQLRAEVDRLRIENAALRRSLELKS